MSDRQIEKSTLVLQTTSPAKDMDLEKIVSYPTWREMLYEMIYENEIDPWNIDLEKVTSAYIEKIKKIQFMDLRIPANIILAAAILLRIKSTRVLEYEQQTTLEDFAEPLSYEQIEAIELKGRIPPKGRITLDDLLLAIEEVMEQTAKREQSKKELEKFLPVLEIKIDEFKVDQEMEKIYQKIKKLSDSYGLVMFSSLLESRTKKDIIYTLIPLLFLAQKEKIILFQETFFGDIFIRLNGK
ncbi:MAG: segregation/condensation protein A [Candidatus Micrarchaeota archaeon]|nr:segregation/condensation protein A [Candidatus Micrarchaeota archaeon]